MIENVTNSMRMPQGKVTSYKLHRLHFFTQQRVSTLYNTQLYAASLIFVHKITVKCQRQEAGEAN